MGKIKWAEVEKECELDQKGNLIVKKIKLQAEHGIARGTLQKLDFFIKIIGILAIFLPLLLLYLQIQNEITKERREYLSSLYTNIIRDFGSIET